MDKDHASARKGLERDTQSLGWFSKFVASAKGLFGLLKLTKKGREMIEGREYRHVSPVFALNQDKEPIRLLSVAATNTPAIRVPENVILNAEPEQSTEQSEDILDMTKEELISIVNEAIEARLTTMNAEPSTTEKVVVNQGNEPTKPNEPVCKSEVCKSDEPSKDESTSCNETDKEDEPEKKVVSTEVETSKEEKDEPEKDAKASEKDDEPEKKDEVIKEEVLNSAPTTSIPKVEEEWRNLKGEAFRKWCAEHAHYCNTYRQGE